MLCLGRESDMWGRGAVGYRITVAPAGAWGVPGPGGDTVMGPGQGEQNIGGLAQVHPSGTRSFELDSTAAGRHPKSPGISSHVCIHYVC